MNENASEQVQAGISMSISNPNIGLGRSGGLGESEFTAFNEQLAHLAQAGLPLEQGLRLVAADLRKGKLSRTIHSLAGELEKGVPLAQAVENHRAEFPSLYSRLIDAGTRGNNLASLLFSLGRYMETQRKLRESIWKAIAYPIVLFVGLLMVLTFVSYFVLPGFAQMQAGWLGVGSKINSGYVYLSPASAPPTAISIAGLPIFSQIVMLAGQRIPMFVACVLAVLVLMGLLRVYLRASGNETAFASAFLLRVPLIGPVLRHGLIARWLEIVRLAVQSGLPLPASLELAGETIGSSKLRQESALMSQLVSTGQSIESGQTRLVPQVVRVAIHIACQPGGDLPATLNTLAEMHHRQAELRIARIPLVVMPALLLLIASSIAIILLAVFAPIVQAINQLMQYAGSGFKM